MKISSPMLGITIMLMDRSERPFLKSFKKPDNPLFSFDVPYVENPAERQHFDLFRADPEKRKNVLLIDIHGGAYLHGWRRNNYPFAQVFREEGYDVICGDYRYVEKKAKTDIKTEVQDLAAMFHYIKAHEGELGIAGDSWAITGDSAGGHFALLFAEILCDENLKNKWGMDANLPKPKCVLINCPVYDFQKAINGNFTKAGRLRMFGEAVNDKELIPYLDPRANLKSLSIPLFFSSCYNDFLKENVVLLEDDCQELGIEYEKVFLETRDKKIAHVHNIIAAELPESRQVNGAMVDFLNKKA